MVLKCFTRTNKEGSKYVTCKDERAKKQRRRRRKVLLGLTRTCDNRVCIDDGLSNGCVGDYEISDCSNFHVP